METARVGLHSSANHFRSKVSICASKRISRSYIVDIDTGDIVSETVGASDSRTAFGVPGLSLLCERFVVDNKALFDKKELISLIRLGLATSSSALGIDSSLLSIPRLGRRFRLSKANNKAASIDIFLTTLTFEALTAACLGAFKLNREQLDFLSSPDAKSRRPVEILTDDQVSMLVADSTILLSTVETPEETAARVSAEAESGVF